MSLTASEKASIVKEYQLDPKDTGSADVQIALLTHRINKLTVHFKTNIHDFHSRRGLLKLVSQRRKLLSYLRKQDSARFFALAKRLKLRVKEKA